MRRNARCEYEEKYTAERNIRLLEEIYGQAQANFSEPVQKANQQQ
jgi:hypothetical protein